jgi:hypothetical protein
MGNFFLRYCFYFSHSGVVVCACKMFDLSVYPFFFTFALFSFLRRLKMCLHCINVRTVEYGSPVFITWAYLQFNDNVIIYYSSLVFIVVVIIGNQFYVFLVVIDEHHDLTAHL